MTGIESDGYLWSIEKSLDGNRYMVWYRIVFHDFR